MTRARVARVLLLAGMVIAIAAGSLALLAAARHDEARTAWSRESRAVRDAGYSPARSDALYAGVLAHRAEAARAAWLLVGGALVMAVGGLALPPPATRGEPATARAATLATLIDATLAAAALAIAVVARDALGAAHAAHGAMVEVALPGVALVAGWGAFGAGRTPGSALLGARLTRRDGSPPGPARASLALVLLPIAIVVSPLTFLRGRTPVHLRWAGLEVHRVGRGRTPSR